MSGDGYVVAIGGDVIEVRPDLSECHGVIFNSQSYRSSRHSDPTPPPAASSPSVATAAT